MPNEKDSWLTLEIDGKVYFACALHPAQKAVWEFLDIVRDEWAPICENCYPIFLGLAKQADALTDLPMKFKHVHSKDRFKRL